MDVSPAAPLVPAQHFAFLAGDWSGRRRRIVFILSTLILAGPGFAVLASVTGAALVIFLALGLLAKRKSARARLGRRPRCSLVFDRLVRTRHGTGGDHVRRAVTYNPTRR